MAVTASQKEFIADLFGGLGGISTRAMMGGLCIYHDGIIFAILGSDEKIYIKAKGPLAHDLEAAGATKFSMTRKNGTIGSMGYWTLPDEGLDDPEVACDWARRALAASDS